MADSWPLGDLPPLWIGSDESSSPPALAVPTSPPSLAGSPPALLSEASSEGEEAEAPLFLAPVRSGDADPVTLAMRLARGGSGMDEIDRSESEGDGEVAGLLGGPLRWADGDDEFPGFGGDARLALGMLGEPLLQLEQYAEAMGISDGLLQQIPVQELLELVMQMPGAGGLPWPFGGTAHSGGGYSAAAGAGFAGAQPYIPEGLEGSARSHAVSMAGQGFATALDPSRHAACAAEGIPCGRQQASPTARHHHRSQDVVQHNVWTIGGAAGAAAPPAAAAVRAAGSRGVVAGSLAAPLLARSLQRVDSASGLQRGDSAASQGGSSSGGGGMRRTAALAPRQGVSRLMGATSTRGVAVHARRSSSSSSEEPPGLVDRSDGEEGRQQMRRQDAVQQQQLDNLQQQQQQQQQPQQQQPVRRRARRNAVFGQLPGLESPDAVAAVAAAAAAAAAQAVAGSSDSDVLQGQAESGWESDQGPPALASRGSSEAEEEEDEGTEAADGEEADWGPPPALEAVLFSREREEEERWLQDEEEEGDSDPPLLFSYSSEGGEPGGTASASSSGSNVVRVTSSGTWTGLGGGGGGTTGNGQQPAAAVARMQRPAFSADQHSVMQALSALLPQQADAAGWAELAAYVRHSSSSSSGGGSGGGVQLLSRLVAAAADRFPAEAETAGLTERPLGLLPPAPVQPAAFSPGTAPAALGHSGAGLAVAPGQHLPSQELSQVPPWQAGHTTATAAAGGELAVQQAGAEGEAAAAAGET